MLQNQDKIIVTVHHHVLQDTTTGSNFGGGEGFHGHSGGVEGSGYLFFTIENEDPGDFLDLYVHDAPRRGEQFPLGWHKPASRTVRLRHAFQPPPRDTREFKSLSVPHVMD